jgi:hypothetical protein
MLDIRKLWVVKGKRREEFSYSLSLRVDFNSDFKHLPIIDTTILPKTTRGDSGQDFHTTIHLTETDVVNIVNILTKALKTFSEEDSVVIRLA